jgi:hypothetical protein
MQFPSVTKTTDKDSITITVLKASEMIEVRSQTVRGDVLVETFTLKELGLRTDT